MTLTKGPLDCILEQVKDPKVEAYQRFASSIYPEEKLNQVVIGLEDYADDSCLPLQSDHDLKAYFSQFNLPYDSKDDLNALIDILGTEVKRREARALTLPEIIRIARLPVPKAVKTAKPVDPVDQLDQLVKPLERTLIDLYRLFDAERNLGQQVIGDDNLSLSVRWELKTLIIEYDQMNLEVLHKASYPYYISKNGRSEFVYDEKKAFNPNKVNAFHLRINRSGLFKSYTIGINILYLLEYINGSSSYGIPLDINSQANYPSYKDYASVDKFINYIKNRLIEISQTDKEALSDYKIKTHLQALNGILSLPYIISKFREQKLYQFPDLEKKKAEQDKNDKALERRKAIIPELLERIEGSVE